MFIFIENLIMLAMAKSTPKPLIRMAHHRCDINERGASSCASDMWSMAHTLPNFNCSVLYL